MKNLIALSSVLVLAGCGPSSSGTFETEDGEEGTYSVDYSGGESTVNIRTDEGSLNIRSGRNVDVDLPAGFDIYPGATVVSNTRVEHDDGSSSSVTITSSASPEKIVDYYRDKAASAGIEISTEIRNRDAVMIGGESDSGLMLSISTSPGDDGDTVASVSLTQKKDR